jgi:hypothetical protein
LESFEFTLELSRDIIDTEAKTITSTCRDATVKFIPTGIDTGYTGTLVEFDREAESLEKAIESAMRDVETVPDLHATGITIPAPERAEPDAEVTGQAEVSTDSASVAEAGTKEKAAGPEKRTRARKAAPKKASPRKTSSRKATAE